MQPQRHFSAACAGAEARQLGSHSLAGQSLTGGIPPPFTQPCQTTKK